MGTQEFLNDNFANEMIPILNGVMLPDGTIWRMSIDQTGSAVSKRGTWTVDDVGDELTYFTELCQVDSPVFGVRVLAGEGGLGADGAICVLDRSSGQIKWLLFMDSSNPFESVEIDGINVVARSTLDQVWKISIEDPSQVVIGRYVP